MKKKLAIFLLIVVLSFSACRSNAYKYDFLPEEALVKNGIPDLPQLPHGKEENTRAELPKAFVYGRYGMFYCTLSYEEFQAYTEEVYEYLRSLNFKYLGYVGEMLGIGNFEFFEGETLSDFYSEDDVQTKVMFVWADGLYESAGHNWLSDWHSLELFYTYEPKTFDDGFTYNVTL